MLQFRTRRANGARPTLKAHQFILGGSLESGSVRTATSSRARHALDQRVGGGDEVTSAKFHHRLPGR